MSLPHNPGSLEDDALETCEGAIVDMETCEGAIVDMTHWKPVRVQ